jgi:acetyl-CoA synthetase
MNFARDVVGAAAPHRLAIVELSRAGGRREWSFGDVSHASAALAGAMTAAGVRRGDVVMTLIGNRPEWAIAMVACFRIGAVALPCNEQLRTTDLRERLDVAAPVLVLADERNRTELAPARPGCPVWWLGDEAGWDDEAAAGGDAPDPPYVELEPEDPCLLTFTSGTAGKPKAVVHAQRYLAGQQLQAEHWLAPRKGELVWCTAASGWSKSARNAFIAPWLRGAAALLHDARFDPQERWDVLGRERVNVLCMAPTEYRVMAKRIDLGPRPDLRGVVAAGEALNPEVLNAWQEATGLAIRDGYGQTETGQLTGMPLGEQPRPGSMGRALPGISLWVDEGELVADPHTVPTFFTGYLPWPNAEAVTGIQERRCEAVSERSERSPSTTPWRTGDRVHADDEGYLYFEGRTDDVIISAGYRIGPFEVESALVAHPAVAEAAVVAAPDDERGSVVRAVVVLRDGEAASEALATELQEHVRSRTAPYKYPRIVDFADELPKTASGKVRRAALRDV